MVSITLQMNYFQIVCEFRQFHSTERNGIYLVHFSKHFVTTKMTTDAMQNYSMLALPCEKPRPVKIEKTRGPQRGKTNCRFQY